jgi:hypothetical protein
MWLIGLAALVLTAAVAFFVWATGETKTRHAAFTVADVVAAIANVLDLDEAGCHDEWDLFLAWPVGDPYLESIRQRCLAIARQHSGREPGMDIGPDGAAELMSILDELTARA